jgi:hypothetical protein
MENLDKDQEGRFQNWIRSTGWFKEYVKEYGEEPDLNIKEYDYRAAWRAGVVPQRDPHDQNRYHWSSVDPQTGRPLKSEDHPTAWKEKYMAETGRNPDADNVTKEQYEKMKNAGSKTLMMQPNPGARKLK